MKQSYKWDSSGKLLIRGKFPLPKYFYGLIMQIFILGEAQ